MKAKKNKGIFIVLIISILIFAAFSAFNLATGSQWIYDSTVSLAAILAICLINRSLRLKNIHIVLITCILIIHNLGTFDFYAWSFGAIQYDNIVHLVSSSFAAYIIFDLLSRKLHIRKEKRLRKTVIEENKLIFVILSIAAVSMCGTIIELIEFSGYALLGEGEGMFFAGIGDSGKLGIPDDHYSDTMTDIAVNIIGAVAGVLVYYFTCYSRRPWLASCKKM